MRSRAQRAQGLVRRWRRGSGGFAVGLVAAALCAGWLGVAQSARAADPPPLIPRTLLLGEPERLRPTLSPDGSKLAYLAPNADALNIWVAPVDAPAQAQPITAAPQGVRAYVWAHTNEHLLYVARVSQREGGGEQHVFSVALDGGEAIDLTPFHDVSARVQQRSPEQPNHALLAVYRRGDEGPALHRVDVRTGAREIVQTNDQGFDAFVTDHLLRVRFAMRFTEEGGQEALAPADDGGWARFTLVPPEDALTTAPIGFSADGSLLYMYDSRGRDTVAITITNTRTGEQAQLMDFDGVDVDGALIHPATQRIQAASFTRSRRVWHALDPAVEDDLRALRTLRAGDFDVVSRSLDDRRWLVAYDDDDSPARYYLYEPETKEASFLFSSQPALDQAPLARMRPVRIAARDGLALVGYLTLPRELDRGGSDDVVPTEPAPLVLTVHSGPWARDAWGFNRLHQLLANRGCAALSVNYRGSTGFGKAFVNAGDGQWGAAMQDDLIDALDWALDKGVADPQRVAIIGSSYGGYAALMGVARDGERFAAGVSMSGPVDIVALLESIPARWGAVIEVFKRRIGDFTTEKGRERLLERSPISRVENVAAPLLIVQGAHDRRVPRERTDAFVQALVRRNAPVLYVVFADEGHGVSDPDNRLAMHALLEAFLGEQLGARAEPLGDALQGVKLEVPVGAELIPGLREALQTANQRER